MTSREPGLQASDVYNLAVTTYYKGKARPTTAPNQEESGGDELASQNTNTGPCESSGNELHQRKGQLQAGSKLRQSAAACGGAPFARFGMPIRRPMSVKLEPESKCNFDTAEPESKTFKRLRRTELTDTLPLRPHSSVLCDDSAVGHQPSAAARTAILDEFHALQQQYLP